jgi:hypothetical protein
MPLGGCFTSTILTSGSGYLPPAPMFAPSFGWTLPVSLEADLAGVLDFAFALDILLTYLLIQWEIPPFTNHTTPSWGKQEKNINIS